MSETAESGRVVLVRAEPPRFPDEARVFVADADCTLAARCGSGPCPCGHAERGPDPARPVDNMRVWFTCEARRTAIARQRAGRPPKVMW